MGKHLEHSIDFFDELHCEMWRWFLADQLPPQVGIVFNRGEFHFPSTAAAFDSPFVAHQVKHFVQRDRHQQIPEIISVGNLREPPVLDSSVEALDGTKGY